MKVAMKNTIRCCISCILPCGVLDVIRIVHANGRVEEISGSVKAEEIMKLYPKHVLKKPSSLSPEEGKICPKIVVVPPDAELQRGKIYFLIPVPPAAGARKTRSKSPSRRRKTDVDSNKVAKTEVSDQYLSEILSEKLSTPRDRRRERVGVWRPHLESICETPSED